MSNDTVGQTPEWKDRAFAGVPVPDTPSILEGLEANSACLRGEHEAGDVPAQATTVGAWRRVAEGDVESLKVCQHCRCLFVERV